MFWAPYVRLPLLHFVIRLHDVQRPQQTLDYFGEGSKTLQALALLPVTIRTTA